jgi:hypothetical protein
MKIRLLEKTLSFTELDFFSAAAKTVIFKKRGFAIRPFQSMGFSHFGSKSFGSARIVAGSLTVGRCGRGLADWAVVAEQVRRNYLLCWFG